jgi:hypothetical protein
MQKVNTGDEILCFQYYLKRKRQTLQWKQTTGPRPTEVRMSKSQTKKMLITFFDMKRTVQFEFIAQGQTVDQVYYVEILKRFYDLDDGGCRVRFPAGL